MACPCNALLFRHLYSDMSCGDFCRLLSCCWHCGHCMLSTLEISGCTEWRLCTGEPCGDWSSCLLVWLKNIPFADTHSTHWQTVWDSGRRPFCWQSFLLWLMPATPASAALDLLASFYLRSLLPPQSGALAVSGSPWARMPVGIGGNRTSSA